MGWSTPYTTTQWQWIEAKSAYVPSANHFQRLPHVAVQERLNEQLHAKEEHLPDLASD
jgi:hypothetical protein